VKSEAVLVARETTNQELIRAVFHPAVLFVGGIYAINWMADKPGGMGQTQAVALEGLLAGVCVASALAPAFPTLITQGGAVASEAMKVLGPAMGALAIMPK